MLNTRSQSPFLAGQRVTRRRSSAGPVAPIRPQRPRGELNRTPRATYLTLRDHGKVYLADLPRLSDGQLMTLEREAREMLDSLSRRLAEAGDGNLIGTLDHDTRIRAATKRDVTERFIRAIEEEQQWRRSNPALQAAADESLARAFLELARHRLPGATFESLLQEALSACGRSEQAAAGEATGTDDSAEADAAGSNAAPAPLRRPQALPVVLTPSATAAAS
ncbi:hypothetical protein [Cyanobium sp. CH-040]|uniref:hypothetical protein n=1 Tax=Cyanobium sp. CH-040 TaxID=2823708 RepID=UPI0020CF811B|nr:hypothetical protein [Cyanobium sp. CH-040]MCP9929035.1 hypothetical protein [Cyanobium sp. CH-040]